MTPASGGARLDALRGAASEAGLEAVLVMPGPNMRYLTGLEFHLSERPVLLLVRVDGAVGAIVPRLEAGKLEAAPTPVTVFPYGDEEGPLDAFAAALDALDLAGAACGVEDRRFRFLEGRLLEAAGPSPRLRGADRVFASLRSHKDAAEIEAMTAAAGIAERAIAVVLPTVSQGQTEREIAGRLVAALLDEGSDPELPFQPAVASGPNGALPHATPTERRLEPGDLVVVDWGARHLGYCSDITRTYAVAGADVPAQLLAAYQAVEGANAAGRAAALPGATGADVDDAARSVIDAAGLGPHFLHRTGHGLGMEVHEEPDMSATNRAPLGVGAAFTVEPGVYLSGVGGVRIEDDVVTAPTGSSTLTTLPRRLTRIG